MKLHILSSILFLSFSLGIPATAVVEVEESTTEADVQDTDDAPPLGLVPRALFTLEVVDREPVEEVTEVSNSRREVLFYTELRDLEGQTVLHRWEREGEVMAEIEFEVRGPRWRVYSKKTLDPAWIGEWSVSVVDPYGRVLSKRGFSYLPPLPAAEEAATVPSAPGSLRIE